jgi:hypothetical protein
MARQIYHMSINVRGVLGWPKRDMVRLFKAEDGSKLTAEEVREFLLDKLSEGNEVLPLGDSCEGWCPKNGCPGHGITLDPA